MAQPTVTPITTYDVVNTNNPGLHRPDVLKKLVEKYPGSYGRNMMQFYDSMGFSMEANNVTFEWWETDFIQSELEVEATGYGPAAGPGLGLTVTLAAASHDASGTRSPMQQDDTLLIKSGVDIIPVRIRAVNKTVNNAHTFTIYPQEDGDTIPAIAGGDKLFLASRQRAEGVGQPEGKTPVLTKYDNDLEIIDASYRITGTEMKVKIWPQVQTAGDGGIKYPSGASVPAGGNYIFVKGADESYWNYEDAKDNALLHHKRTDNFFNMGDTARSTNGLIPEIIAGGNTWSWSPGNISIQWIDQLTKQIKRKFGAKNYHCWLGIDLYQELQNFFATAFTNGGINYASFLSREDVALAYKFRSFKKTEIQFNFKEYEKWNHPKTFGNTNYRFSEMGLFIPTDTVMDPKTNVTTPGMCLRYLPGRKNFQWSTGAWSSQNKTEIDELNIHWKCEIGIMVPARNRYWLIRPSS